MLLNLSLRATAHSLLAQQAESLTCSTHFHTRSLKGECLWRIRLCISIRRLCKCNWLACSFDASVSFTKNSAILGKNSARRGDTQFRGKSVRRGSSMRALIIASILAGLAISHISGVKLYHKLINRVLHKPRSMSYSWVWVKVKPPADRRFQSMFPLTRVPFWVPFCWPTLSSQLKAVCELCIKSPLPGKQLKRIPDQTTSAQGLAMWHLEPPAKFAVRDSVRIKPPA